MNKNLPLCLMFFSCSFMLFFSSSSWFPMWVSMELNTMMFICLLFDSNKQKMESVLSYFIIQSVSSLFILFSFLSNEMWLLALSSPSLTLMVAICLKLGSAPFHSWFIPMAFNLSNKLLLWMILTVQKAMPLILLMWNSNKMNYTLLLFIILCVILGSSMNISQASMKMMIILSSLSNMGWMLMSTMKMANMENYFLVYTVMLAMMMPFLSDKMKIHSSKKQSSMMMLCLMMLGGMPPLMGFFPKLMVSMSMVEKEMFIILSVMLMASTVDMLVYSRMSFLSAMSSKTSLFWEKVKKNKMWTFFLINSLTTMIWI